MLSKCANPPCSAPFRYLREGRLYLLDYKAGFSGRKPTADLKLLGTSRAFDCLWLCSSCCRDMTIQIDNDHRVRVVYKQAAQATVVGPAYRSSTD